MTLSISDQELRQEITVGCNKVESYNRFVKWLSFGSESTIMDHDPEEAEKEIKYGSLLSNAVILHNVYDMTAELKRLIVEGYPVQAEDLVFLSPYMTGHIKWFGDYVISDSGDLPSLEVVLNWNPPPSATQEAQNTQPIASG